MRPIATDVARSVCLLDTTIICAKTAEPTDMPFGGVDSAGRKKPCIRWGSGSPRKGAILGRHFPADCNEISGVSQSYSLGGSSDAAFHCQYCSNVFLCPRSYWRSVISECT